MAAPPPQSYPYDYLFKILIIGDASVGKVSNPETMRIPTVERAQQQLIHSFIYSFLSFSLHCSHRCC
jgi:GTPase SAR1 family protein